MTVLRKICTFILFSALLFLTVTPLPVQAGEVRRIAVLFVDTRGRELCRFDAELAITPAEQARGLMYRSYIPRRNGMLFIDDREAMQHYWMKNVYIPLDIIFINGQDEVVYVHQNARPHDETTISSRYPARYIVEVNAGEAEECKIKKGAKVHFGATGRR